MPTKKAPATPVKKAPAKKVPRKTTRARKEEATVKTVLAAVADIDAPAVVAKIGALQVVLQTTLANLSASITGKIEQMEHVDMSIGIKQAELTELYDIEQEAMSLDEVKQQREQNDANWEDYVSGREKDWNDKESDRRQRWEREEEERLYGMNKLRQRSSEDHTAQVNSNHRNEQIRQEDLQRQWDERETELKDQENEITNLRASVAGFDEKTKAEVGKAEAIVGNKLKRQYDHEKALMLKDMDAQKALQDAQVISLNQRITSLGSQRDEAQDALRVAQQDAKDVTTKALDSASGRAVASAVQKTVEMSQQSKK